MQWIECSKVTPPRYVQVLAYGMDKGKLSNGAHMDICVWDGEAWWDEGGTELSQEGLEGKAFWGDGGWTHWMCLPAEPTVVLMNT